MGPGKCGCSLTMPPALTIKERRRRRKFPSPPPTPEGMVYASWVDKWGNRSLRLVPEKEFSAYIKKEMDIVDSLTPEERQKVYETGELPPRAKRAIGV